MLIFPHTSYISNLFHHAPHPHFYHLPVPIQVGLQGAVDEQANFQTFWGSMVLLLRFSTGENWNGFMYDMVAERDNCESQPEYDPDMCGFTDHANCTPLNGCGSWSIFPYMIRYVSYDDVRG